MLFTLVRYVKIRKKRNKRMLLLNLYRRCLQRVNKIEYQASRYLDLFSCKTELMCPCKGETQVANYCKCKFIAYMEKNPSAPMYLSDPNKTLALPCFSNSSFSFVISG